LIDETLRVEGTMNPTGGYTAPFMEEVKKLEILPDMELKVEPVRLKAVMLDVFSDDTLPLKVVKEEVVRVDILADAIVRKGAVTVDKKFTVVLALNTAVETRLAPKVRPPV